MTNQELRARIAELQTLAKSDNRLGMVRGYRNEATRLSKILARREYDVKSAHVLRAIAGAY